MLQRLHVSELAMAHDMPRAGHSHTGRALCAVVAEQCLRIWKTPAFSKTARPTKKYTRPARPPHPVQAPPHLLHTSEAAFELAGAHGMTSAGHSHTGGALCAVVAECCLLLLWKSPQTGGKTSTPHNTCPTLLQPPVQSHHICCIVHWILPWPMACPGLATYTLAGLCALWLPPRTGNLH